MSPSTSLRVDGIASLAGVGAVSVMVFYDDFTAPLAGEGIVVVGAGFEPVPEFFEDRLEWCVTNQNMTVRHSRIKHV